MPALLRAFRAAHPAVRLTVLEGSDDEVLEWLLTGAVDVGTVAAAHPALAVTPLATDRMVAVLATGHPLADLPSVAVADLAREPFVMSAGGCAPLIEAIACRAGVRLRTHYEVRDSASVVAMVAERLGVTIMPELALPASAGGVRALPLAPAEERRIGLALPADARPQPAAAAFVELAGGVPLPS
jgi:DNA-binding transcriptional LysR family regulator